MDSWDSTIQPQIVFGVFSDAVSDCAKTFVMPFWSFFFLKHDGCQRCFQFSSRILESFFEILVVQIDKVNQSPSIVELRLHCCPFLFFSILSGFANVGPYFWPYMIWSGGLLNLCQSPSRTTNICWEVFSFNRVDFVNPFHESAKFLFECWQHRPHAALLKPSGLYPVVMLLSGVQPRSPLVPGPRRGLLSTPLVSIEIENIQMDR